MPLDAPQMYCAQQIFIDPTWCRVLKDFEKAMLRKGAASMDEVLLACKDWFVAADALHRARQQREEAWYDEYTGRKGDIRALFDKLDVDGDGLVTREELQEVFDGFGSFFGFSAEAPPSGPGGAADASPRRSQADASSRRSQTEDMLSSDVPLWLDEERAAGKLGALALFEKLDRDHNGVVSWDEFWHVVDGWLTSGFDRVDELRALREARLAEEARAREEEARRAAEEAAARAAAEREARRQAEAAAREAKEAARQRREAEAREKERLKAEEDERRMARARLERERAEAKRRAEFAEEAKRRPSSRALQLAAEQRQAERESDLAAERAYRRQSVTVDRGRAERAAAEARRREEQHGRWHAACEAFDAYAAAAPRSVDELAEAALAHLHAGEPGLAPPASVLALLADDAPRLLAPLASTTAAEQALAVLGLEQAAVGAAWRPDAPALAGEGFRALASGQVERAQLGDGALPWYVAPLRQLNGHAFGVLASGPPAMPVEFLELLAARAAPALEAAWRRHKLGVLLAVAAGWLDELLAGRCAPVAWAAKGAARAGSLDVELHALAGGRLGALRVALEPGAELNALQLALLEASAELLQGCAHELERLNIGGATPVFLVAGGEAVGSGADAAAAMLLPRMLLQRVGAEVGGLDAKRTLAELRSYPQPPECVTMALAGVLCVLGRRRRELAAWADVRAQLKESLLAEMRALDATARSKRRPWADSRALTKGLTSDEVLTRGSRPVQVLFKWLEVARLAHRVGVRVRKEAAEAEADDDGALPPEPTHEVVSIDPANVATGAPPY